nr:MAG: hypothetical protein J07AB56_12000 [Candidatus Nanosalinarum sp. J07AB56]
MVRETNNNGQDVLVFAFEISCEQTRVGVDGEEILDYRWASPREALDTELRLDNRREVIQAFDEDRVVDDSILHENLKSK